MDVASRGLNPNKLPDTLTTMSQAIKIFKPVGAVSLPDNDQWDNRFHIKSQTSNRLYVIARNKSTGKFGCSCPSYRVRRYCKHLLQGCSLSTSQIHGHGQIKHHRHEGIC
jgi:hypothetical protein